MLPTGKTAATGQRRIGRYRIIGRIGRGGMGMVYRGLDEVLEREVAVKTLTLEGTLDEESHKRFQIEARAAAKLQHPNIITVFELGEDRGVPFIAMELLPGMDLEVLLRSAEAFLLQEKLEIVIQVLRGLAFAHEHGIVHRDIKPSNVRVLDDGTVKIMDFGIAKLGGTNVTKSGMMVGTVHYMSPEQIRGQGLDGRSDVFSMGVILHELLAGGRPFTGEGPTAVLYKIVHEPPAPLPLGELGESGEGLREIVGRALAKEPGSRYAGASAMAEAVAAVLTSHTRALETTVSSQDVEILSLVRRMIKDGRYEDGQRRLREVVERTPHSVEARRALRTAAREIQRRQRPAETASEDFPELDSTFQASPTRRAPETLLQPTVLDAPPTAPGASSGAGRELVLGLIGVAVLALGAAVYLLRSGGPPPAVASRIAVRSRPAGAAVLLDGKDTGKRTDGVVELPSSGRVLLTLRKEGFRDGARTLSLPLASGEDVSMDLLPLEARLPVISDPVLLGSVTIASAYPLEVSWRGRVLSQAQASPRVSLPAGRQSLSLLSPGVFLRTTLTVDVKGGGDAAVEAPGLGKVSIKANPDNCRVFIDGTFVDYPPILDKPLVAGTHTVSFQWAGGGRSEETVAVARGGIAFVTGRRD